MSYLYSKLPETGVPYRIGTGGDDLTLHREMQVALVSSIVRIARHHIMPRTSDRVRLGFPGILEPCGTPPDRQADEHGSNDCG